MTPDAIVPPHALVSGIALSGHPERGIPDARVRQSAGCSKNASWRDAGSPTAQQGVGQLRHGHVE
jgi:hypothetical protein